MTRITFDAETGTDGTTCTAGNTGFDQVNVVGGTNAFEADAAIHGSMGYRIVTVSGSANQYIENFPASTGEVAIRVYFKVPTGTVTASSQLATVRNSGGNMAIIAIDTSKRLVCQDATGGDTMTPGSALPAVGTVIRAELRVVKGASTTTGVRHFAYYLGDSTTAVYEATDSTSNTGTTNATNGRLGRTSGSTWVTTIDLDDFVLDDAPAGALIGPVTSGATVLAVTATATVLAEPPAVSAEVVATSTGAATASVLAYAPTVTAGATVTAVRANTSAAAGIPTVSISATVTAVCATATVAAGTPTVTAAGASVVQAVRATVTAAAIAPTVHTSATVTAPTATLTIIAGVPVISAGATVYATTALIATSATAPVVGGPAPVFPLPWALTVTAPDRTLSATSTDRSLSITHQERGLTVASATRELTVTSTTRTLRVLEES
jgi:hypothetical protein